MATFSKLAARQYTSMQRSSRNGVVPTKGQLHHGATTNGEWIIDVEVSGSKQVSSNYVMLTDGTLAGVVDEAYRAWTSADATFDRQSITVEVANLSTNGWTISDSAHEKLAQLMADCSKRYGWGKLNRSGPFSTWNVIGHREINQHTGGSYATACPGAMDLDRIVRRGNEILAGTDTASTTNPEPITEPTSLNKEKYMYFRRISDGLIALFNGTGVHPFTSVQDYSDHRTILEFNNKYAPENKVYVPPAAPGQVVGLSDGGWSNMVSKYSAASGE